MILCVRWYWRTGWVFVTLKKKWWMTLRCRWSHQGTSLGCEDVACAGQDISFVQASGGPALAHGWDVYQGEGSMEIFVPRRWPWRTNHRFLLTAKRDLDAAWRFFERAIWQHDLTASIKIDKHSTNAVARHLSFLSLSCISKRNDIWCTTKNNRGIRCLCLCLCLLNRVGSRFEGVHGISGG